jgi:hypothetical protein
LEKGNDTNKKEEESEIHSLSSHNDKKRKAATYHHLFVKCDFEKKTPWGFPNFNPKKKRKRNVFVNYLILELNHEIPSESEITFGIGCKKIDMWCHSMGVYE